MTAAEFRSAVKTGLRGGYILYGDEEYTKSLCMTAARKSVIPDKSDEAFNLTVLNQENYSLLKLAESIEMLPVFSEKRLVEVHGLDISNMSEDDITEFCEVLAQLKACDFTVLILYASKDEFDAGTFKSPSKAYKQLTAYLTPVVFDFETSAKLNKWIIQQLNKYKVSIAPEFCTVLVNYCGRDMFNISNEVDKLAAYVLSQGRSEVSAEDIDNVTPKTKEINDFDFTNAILSGDLNESLAIMSKMKLQNEKPEILLSGVSRVFTDLLAVKTLSDAGNMPKDISAKLKMHEYKAGLYCKNCRRYTLPLLDKAVSMCYIADMKLKSSQLDSYTVLDNLVIELLNIK